MRGIIVVTENVAALRIDVITKEHSKCVLWEDDRIEGVRHYEERGEVAIFVTLEAMFIAPKRGVAPPSRFSGIWVGSGCRETGLPSFGCLVTAVA